MKNVKKMMNIWRNYLKILSKTINIIDD